MENNILTAKEWLEKEGVFPYNHFTIEDDINKMPRTEEIMERYADYRTKMLQGKILEFRQILEKQAVNHAIKLYKDWFKTDQIENNTVLESYISCVKEDMLLKEFDKHFEIEIKTENKIN